MNYSASPEYGNTTPISFADSNLPMTFSPPPRPYRMDYGNHAPENPPQAMPTDMPPPAADFNAPSTGHSLESTVDPRQLFPECQEPTYDLYGRYIARITFQPPFNGNMLQGQGAVSSPSNESYDDTTVMPSSSYPQSATMQDGEYNFFFSGFPAQSSQEVSDGFDQPEDNGIGETQTSRKQSWTGADFGSDDASESGNDEGPTTPPPSPPTKRQRPSGSVRHSPKSNDHQDPASKKRLGNNPHGSKGCRTCGPCRKRKGHCKFDEDDESQPCSWCIEHNTHCTEKYTKAEYDRVSGRKPAGKKVFSAIVEDLERKNPNALPSQIAQWAMIRLKTTMESLPSQRKMKKGSPSTSSSTPGEFFAG